MAPIKPRSVVAEDAHTTSGSLSILLVEDEDMVRLATEKMLQRFGHTVVTATDGIDALKILEVGGVQIDVILSDVMMPGIGGVELAKRVRTIEPGIKILFMTGYMDEPINDDSPDIKSIPILRKPFGLNELQKQIQGIAEKH